MAIETVFNQYLLRSPSTQPLWLDDFIFVTFSFNPTLKSKADIIPPRRESRGNSTRDSLNRRRWAPDSTWPPLNDSTFLLLRWEGGGKATFINWVGNKPPREQYYTLEGLYTRREREQRYIRREKVRLIDLGFNRVSNSRHGRISFIYVISWKARAWVTERIVWRVTERIVWRVTERMRSYDGWVTGQRVKSGLEMVIKCATR